MDGTGARHAPLQERTTSRGTASSQGVTADWRRDAEANTLTVTVSAMPILTDCGTVQAVLREVVRSCSGA